MASRSMDPVTGREPSNASSWVGAEVGAAAVMIELDTGVLEVQAPVIPPASHACSRVRLVVCEDGLVLMASPSADSPAAASRSVDSRSAALPVSRRPDVQRPLARRPRLPSVA